MWILLRFGEETLHGCILTLFVCEVQSLITGTAGGVCLCVDLMYIGSQWSGVHTKSVRHKTRHAKCHVSVLKH